jgi:hypothetical protein
MSFQCHCLLSAPRALLVLVVRVFFSQASHLLSFSSERFVLQASGKKNPELHNSFKL